MNKKPSETVEILEKEKDISKDTLIEVIENSLLITCKDRFGKADNIKVTVNPNAHDFVVHAEGAVVGSIEDDCPGMSLADTKMPNPKYGIGDTVQIPLDPKEFDRVTTQNVGSVILQKTCEEERKTLYNEYYVKEKDATTGVVQRYLGRNMSVNLGGVDAILNESEQVKGETFRPAGHIRVYVIEAKDTPKGPRVSVLRTHPDLVKRLFRSGVAKIRDGTVGTKAIAREAGSRTKIAMKSSDANMNLVGVYVDLDGLKINSIVSELKGEKVDIIDWGDNPACLTENVPSLVKVIYVMTDKEKQEAQVIVPGYQLSLAIDKGGQNMRLAAGLTGFEIDIESGTQAREMGLFGQTGFQYGDTPSEAYEEEAEETEDYRGYEENYQGDGGE